MDPKIKNIMIYNNHITSEGWGIKGSINLFSPLGALVVNNLTINHKIT